VTVVVMGVWTSGFGLFKRAPSGTPANPISRTMMSSVWGGETPAFGGTAGRRAPGQDAPLAPVNAVNGYPVPGAAPGEVIAAAVPPVDGPVEGVAPRAPNFIPDAIQLYEAHWQGMDTRLLTSELRRKLRFPQGLEGVLVGEVSLDAARSGLLGGDVIIAVSGQPVTTLESFQEATRAVASQKEATLAVLRKTGPKDRNGVRSTMMRLTLVLTTERELGFAQVEGAPMIKAGDPRPHGDRGPCTQCHTIGTGFELAPDPDLITLPPPVLSRDIAAKGVRPHEDRGPCQACHVISP